METTAPARLARKKRLSHEEDTHGETADNLLPSPKSAKAFVAAQSSPLLATFVIAWVWFAQVVAPCAVPLAPTKPSAHPVRTGLDAFGLALATGSPSLLHLDRSPVKLAPPRTEAVRRIERAARPAAGEAPEKWQADAGLFLATGSPTLLHLDRHTTSPPPVVPAAPQRSPSDPLDMRAFVLTCALVHTLLVGIGFAFGSDTLHPTSDAIPTMLIAGVVSFLILCASLYAAWELQIGPVPPVAAHLFASETAFVVGGAASATAWIALSMLCQHTQFGRSWSSSPRLCALTALSGVAVIALDLSVTLSLVSFFGLVAGAAAMGAAAGRIVGGHAGAYSRVSPSLSVDMWNL